MKKQNFRLKKLYCYVKSLHKELEFYQIQFNYYIINRLALLYTNDVITQRSNDRTSEMEIGAENKTLPLYLKALLFSTTKLPTSRGIFTSD